VNQVRTRALKLRLAGKSYNEIKKELGVPKSTLSGWFKHVVLSDKARARLTAREKSGSATLVKRNKMQTQRAEQRAREAQREGMRRIKDLSVEDLLVMGATLYWAEGYKRLQVRDGKERMGHRISFLNTDPVMISVFVRFLREGLGVLPEHIHLTMRLYAHISEEEARRHWIRATGLPASCFRRTTAMVSGASKGRRPFNRLPYGTLEVSVNDTPKFHHLLGLIEGVKARAAYGTLSKLPR
jgi:hypothetical protein